MKRKYIASVGGVATVLVACVLYLFLGILHVPVLSSATTVQVDLPRSGGLYAGAGVAYRGVVVGKVTAMSLTDQAVQATVRLDAGTRIPADSTARVRSLSPIGEQYLDLEPRVDAAPYLQNGAHLTATATDVPQTVADLAISLDKLMGQVDPKKVHTALSELATGFSGAQADLQRLIGSSLEVVRTFDDNSGLLTRFGSRSRRFLQTGADTRVELISATRDLATFTAWLRRFQPQLYRMVDRAPGQIAELRRLVADLVDVLPGYLDAQGDLSTILNDRNQQIRAFLRDFPAGLDLFAGAMTNGHLQIDQILRRGPYCQYSTSQRSPRDVSFRALQDGGRCPSSVRTFDQRGAQFAPGAN